MFMVELSHMYGTPTAAGLGELSHFARFGNSCGGANVDGRRERE